MDAFAIAVSLGLQYGVPLEAFAKKFINMRFEPSGITSDQDVRFASSLVDYVFRRLALDYLSAEKREELGIRSVEERKAAINGGGYAPAPVEGGTAGSAPKPTELQTKDTVQTRAVDAPLCYSCGSKMQPSGSCYVCTSCGSTSGCS
jgi:ribonucleoside-diphosphate reductase alpha chain